MITDEALAAWREEFLAEFGLERDALDESLLYAQEKASAPRARLPEGAVPPREASTEERIPVRYADALPASPEVRAWMATLTRRALASRRVVVSVGTGPSLLLLGITGTGKTHEAYGMVRGLAALGVRSRWRATTAADLYAKMRPRHGVDSEAVFEEHAGASLLVVDDLGAVKNSEWIEEVNFRLVNNRYERMLPTLFTSNLAPKELANTLGERVASRLAEMTDRVTLKGTDRRYAA
jgi:DNA replication protein DnaC